MKDLIQLKYGKDFYHLIPEMEKWAESNIGPGKWYYSTEVHDKPYKWYIDSMFGTTTFYFAEQKYKEWFALRWQ